ncbi:MAG TPA: ketoacyl-ACP synthase III [Polyangiaceae bacterium]
MPGNGESRSQARLSALGAYVPERVVTNDELSSRVDTSDAWIVQRTGIRERRYAAEGEYTSDLCEKAVRALALQPGVRLDDVDHVIVGTTTPDLALPSVACILQHRLGLPSARAFDLNATCAGFVYALELADALVSSGRSNKVLICVGETLSKVIDFEDRSTCVLFGDGAAAVLVERDPENPSFLAHAGGSDGAGGLHLYRSGLAEQLFGQALKGGGKVVQNGREVYRWAVQTVSEAVPRLVERSGHRLDEVTWFVPHSANQRILDSVCQRIGFPGAKVLESLSCFGNTSAATIPLALDRARAAGKLRRGDLLLLYGFGGGLVHGGTLLRW